MKRLLLVAVAVAVGIGGTGAAVSAEVAPATAKIAWGECPTDVTGGQYLEDAECGQVEVPLDYGRPGGRKISLAVSRVKATDKANYQGVLIGNPGGPGASGLYLSGGLASWLPPEVAARYDIIGFDPRGVESSKPAISCIPDYSDPTRPDYVPANAREEAAWLARSKRYADACAKKYGWMLPHMRTTNSARDLDSIRKALGVPQISYYGFSYGTYLGATYASMFPKNVKRMVWDGNVDSRNVWYEAQLRQNEAFERNMKLWWAWIAKYHSLYGLGRTEAAVEANYYKVRAAAEKSPIGGKIGPSELDDIVLTAGYHTGFYIPFAEALSAWVTKKDPAPLLGWVAEGGGDNSFAIYLAVQAVDAPWPPKWRTWHNDAARQYKKGIRFNAWSNTWFNAPIHFWGADAGKAFPIGDKRKAAPPILLVQSTLDAATPYPGGPQMRKLFPSATLLAELGGKTHANTLNGNACVDGKVAAYLFDGTLPRRKPGQGADVTCDAVPALNDPDPTANTLRSAGPGKGKDVVIGRP
ncbi:peptidase [Actinomadura sp. NBRC 104412]|uniref:alpha/beta hydrolase n=1 Tax=Actinomadura sp. NBRC 104412 TaxID=3032203 RepID=UPI0024A508DF|nr:alpha/beta hydrolase [Actinomadura sp. NBRC 104412]GLZ04492.1 peptidase [Actinomadura sp. NBRC 104412]